MKNPYCPDRPAQEKKGDSVPKSSRSPPVMNATGISGDGLSRLQSTRRAWLYWPASLVRPRRLEGVGLGDWIDIRLNARHVLALMRWPMTIFINQKCTSTIGFNVDVGRGVLQDALISLSYSFGSPG